MTKISMYRIAVIALVAAVATPSMSSAQQLTAPAAPIAAPSAAASMLETAPLAGPRVVQVGVTRADAESLGAASIQRQASRRDVSWMVLGGAALVVGSLVGGDGGTIIMITGGVIGLVGLWRYLQYS